MSVKWNSYRWVWPMGVSWLLIDNSFNITCMFLLLHLDILSVEVGVSAILPFSCFLVHHVGKVSAHEREKIEYAETEVYTMSLWGA